MLLVLGLVLSIPVLWVFGTVLVTAGAALAILGPAGPAVDHRPRRLA
jgi:hypothetical protein